MATCVKYYFMVHDYTPSLYDYYLNVVKEHTLVFYKGAFDERVISEISQSIRRRLLQSSSVNKRLFSVFIELAQNIAFYSAERNILNNKNKGSGIGLLVINEHNDFFTIKTGNLVENKDSFRLAAKCANINSLNRDGLRQLKRRQRNQPSVNKDSGNIGLIQIALLGNSPLRIDLKTVDNRYSFFSLEIDIHKKTMLEEDI